MNRCRATAKRSGQQCQRGSIPGGTVCKKHGGGAPQVRRKAAERLADLIDPDRALREAARLAYSDITELYDADGKLLPMKQWPKHIRAAISGLETTDRGNVDKADGQYDKVVKVRLWDKPKNLEMLFKHLGLLEERLSLSITMGLDERIKAARKRAGSA